MTFPDKYFGDIGAYADAYYDRLSLAAASIDRGALAGAVRILKGALDRDAQIFSCGNGGSASIANHLLCDFAKGIQTDTTHRPRVVSLASNVEILTAIANDISYDDVFVYQLATQAREGDVLMTISSSGDSENVIRALAHARANGIPTIAMTGFFCTLAVVLFASSSPVRAVPFAAYRRKNTFSLPAGPLVHVTTNVPSLARATRAHC